MIKVKLSGKKYCTKLSVFDFDGTLFKSPEKPEGYKGNWWIEAKSLNPPAVPKKPNDSFWNMDVVESAKRELSDPKNCVILMTGRVDQFFEDRINELIKQKSLNFKHTWLNQFGRSTSEFKIEKMRMVLRDNPSIKTIEMWEDEPDKAADYKKEFGDMVKINLIKGRKLNEMYYYDPEYPDTNLNKMSHDGVSIDGFDFYFEKSDQREKAFDAKTLFFVVEASKGGIIVFEKTKSYDPFVEFAGKFKSLEQAKSKLNISDDNYIIVKKDLGIS